ncbi:filamentous hemagglutinin-like protein [Kalymmatonema gypsitolerans NIES-4073]|nr:filamentous hemagglutinin-like protein [Scytonema sp. NIES-4073]
MAVISLSNAPSGFIVAKPQENSDITSNPFTGFGSRIQINASGIATAKVVRTSTDDKT